MSVEVVPRTAALVVKNPQGSLEVVDAEGVAFREVAKAPAGVPLVIAVGAGIAFALGALVTLRCR